MQNKANLAIRIALARKARGLTQKDLAERLEISQSDVSKLENGQTKDPALFLMKRLADALSVTLEAFVHEDIEQLTRELVDLPAQDEINHEEDNRKRVEAWKRIRRELNNAIIDYWQTGDEQAFDILCTKEISEKIRYQLNPLRAMGLVYNHPIDMPQAEVVYPLPGEEGQDFIIQEQKPDNLSRILTGTALPLSITIRIGGEKLYQIERYQGANDLQLNIEMAKDAAKAYLGYKGPLLRLPYQSLNACLPGGAMRKSQLAMILGKSGSGKTILALNMVNQYLRDDRTVSYVSLEQPRVQIWIRLLMQYFDMSHDEIIAELDKEHNEKFFKDFNQFTTGLEVIDNVPENFTDEVKPMTVNRLGEMISAQSEVVILDHLGILCVDDNAPQSVKDNDNLAGGYLMQELFKLAKVKNILIIVLNNLPKEVRSGVEFSYDAGRGTTRQTDYCDYILTCWRPQYEEGISEEEIRARMGSVVFAFSKNRHGPNGKAHLMLDTRTLHIQEQTHWQVRFDEVDEPEDGPDLLQ